MDLRGAILNAPEAAPVELMPPISNSAAHQEGTECWLTDVQALLGYTDEITG